ncbi:hypothetical protein RYX36_017652 [Vicia faba]
MKTSACDGILCISIELIADCFVLLYNPSIRKLNILPPLELPRQTYVQSSYTLVYDPFTNNYKIIAIHQMRSNKIEVYIHTLAADYWRRIQDFSSCYLVPKPGIFVNDSVNWVVDAACDSDFHAKC